MTNNTEKTKGFKISNVTEQKRFSTCVLLQKRKPCLFQEDQPINNFEFSPYKSDFQ